MRLNPADGVMDQVPVRWDYAGESNAHLRGGLARDCRQRHLQNSRRYRRELVEHAVWRSDRPHHPPPLQTVGRSNSEGRGQTIHDRPGCSRYSAGSDGTLQSGPAAGQRLLIPRTLHLGWLKQLLAAVWGWRQRRTNHEGLGHPLTEVIRRKMVVFVAWNGLIDRTSAT